MTATTEPFAGKRMASAGLTCRPQGDLKGSLDFVINIMLSRSGFTRFERNGRCNLKYVITATGKSSQVAAISNMYDPSCGLPNGQRSSKQTISSQEGIEDRKQ
jgi:hypothetical protein